MALQLAPSADPSAAKTLSAPKRTPLQRRAAILRMVLPHVPHVLLKSTSHILSLSPQSPYWDLRATVTVEFLRSILHQPSARPPTTVETIQAATCRPVKVGADTWRAEVTYGAEDGFNAEQAVHDAIVGLGGDRAAILKVGFAQLTGEWISARSHPIEGPSTTPQPGAQAMYEALAADTPNKESAILYLHGGAYILCDPHSHRNIVINLCKTSKTRAFLPRYRLAPQHPFPAAVIDALLSYLYLLYPPPGAFHAPIKSENITFAGDSAGGGLSLALVQLIMQLQRTKTRIHWYDRDIQVPLPGGCATLSSWCDISRCFGPLADFPAGSEDSCSTFDYLPSAHGGAKTIYLPSPAWNPELQKQRGQSQFYAPDALMTNPLASPLLSESWVGAPKMWISVGDEHLRDQNLYLAHRFLQDGVKLRFEKYTAMPHVFQGMLQHLKVSKKAWENLGKFVTGETEEEGYWGLARIHPKTLAEEPVDAKELKVAGLELGEVREMVAKATRRFAEIARGVGKAKI